MRPSLAWLHRVSQDTCLDALLSPALHSHADAGRRGQADLPAKQLCDSNTNTGLSRSHQADLWTASRSRERGSLLSQKNCVRCGRMRERSDLTSVPPEPFLRQGEPHLAAIGFLRSHGRLLANMPNDFRSFRSFRPLVQRTFPMFVGVASFKL